MFADHVIIYCKAGDGGDGSGSFRREAHIPRGGPNGGDGGDGGNVIIQATADVQSLANLVGHRHWNAQKGAHGESNLKKGKSGDDIIILVPPGTIIRDYKRGHILKDLNKVHDQITIAKGGKGGRGNKHFASATNRSPRQFEKGTLGDQRNIVLELKLIADVGLLGKPNAGKSTLLSRLSRAEPEIADYPFTTKYPNLGMVRMGYEREYVLADIPGLIEGAHAGIGLGHEFLKHVERTRLLVHLVEPAPVDGTDPVTNYLNIREELRLYDESLMTRPEIIVITKSELPDAQAAAQLLEEELKQPVLRISAVTGQGLPELNNLIFDHLAELKSQLIGD